MKIRCDKIYTQDGCINGILEIANGKIKNIIECDECIDALDMREYRILPGFIDIHTHGYLGCLAQSLDKNELIQLSSHMASIGVTSFLATVGEHFPKEMENLHLLSEIIEEKQELGAKMLGINMEGPFLNPNKCGSFTKNQLLLPNIEKLKEYVKMASGHLLYMSLAPELDKNGELICYLKENNIIVGGGHTLATSQEFKDGITYGIQVATHTGNAMRQITQREVGALGAALLDDNIYCEIICDFFHLSKEMLELFFKIKKDCFHKMIMISDSGHLSGFPPGVYKKYTQIRIIDEDGHILLEDGTIAGSSRNILYGVQNLEQKMHINMQDIILMTSLNPATLLGIQDKKGSIKVGKDADFIILNQDYKIVSTFVEGKEVYTNLNL